MSGYSKRNNLLIPSFGNYNGTTLNGIASGRVGATIALSSTFTRFGNSAQTITGGSGGAFDLYIGQAKQYFYQVNAPVVTFSVYIRRDDGHVILLSDLANIYIANDATGTAALISSSVTADINNWFRVVATAPVTAGSNLLFVGVNMINNLPPTHTIYFDAWQVEAGYFATPWESITVGDRQHNKWKSK
jgi:hypothetical protein